MSLDKATVLRIAHLARIRVPDNELEHLAGELSNILSFVEQLRQVDTADVPPLTSVVAMKLRQRPDRVTDGGYPQDVVANAPESVQDFISVPKVIE